MTDKKKCQCGHEHATAEDMIETIQSLEGLIAVWEEDGKISASEMIDIFVSVLVEHAEEQDDPAAAITDLKERIDEEFATKPEDRPFTYVEAN